MPRDLGLVWQDLRAVAAWNVRRRSLVELPGAVSHAGPDDVRLISDDLPRFLAALDAGGRARDFERLYFASASAGLREFRHRRAAEFAGLAGRVARRRAFYASARPLLTELHADEGWRLATRTALREVARLVPHARFPDVTLAVGGFGVGGTAGLSGLLLAAEFFLGCSGVETRPLSAWERAALRPPRLLPFVVVHELAHALQRRAYREVTDPTLLSLSVYEGVADLLAFLATGERPHGPAFAYGLAHEAALWAEFRRVMARAGGRGWLYEGDRTRGRPADLGYFVGFRIAQTALARGVVTVPGLLDVRDPFALLAASGYDPAPDRDRFDPR